MRTNKRTAKPKSHPHYSDQDLRDLNALAAGDYHEPHRWLGAHPAQRNKKSGAIVRVFHPETEFVELLREGQSDLPFEPLPILGMFECFVENAAPPFPYGLRFKRADGYTWEQDDSYRFMPSLGDTDLYLFNEGKHRHLWNALGARVVTIDGVTGVAFAVWAPNARRVSVVGDFCGWDGRRYPMRQMGSSGVWELFIPNVQQNEFYKYELKTAAGDIRVKTDPMATAMEHPPGTASRIYQSRHNWQDHDWMHRRATRDWHREPVAIYELHLASWMKHEDGRPLSYREIAPKLVDHVKRFGFTHIEPLPLAEHPFDGSWGYQVSGYYAPTSRFGDPDDFRWFIDYCHQHNVGVIVDWVPAHFPKDDFALRRFDGSALYEHDDPRRGEHPDWGTLIFNYGRNEVRNFLVANALYWLNELHVDGLRVDAVASMLYLDYSRKEGEWIPNEYGGRENIDAINFLRELNSVIREESPGAMMVAEESTSWGGVSRPVEQGGLGFTFKWNMGWMHDTLLYFSKDPVYRRFHHNDLTFAMIYEHTESFVMPLSHDEVVHGKGSLLNKLPGDLWQQFANLRTLLAYQYTRPGKLLLFMGTELAPWYEWNYQVGLDWSIAEHPERAGLQCMMEELGRFYLDNPALWASDPDHTGTSWIDCHDSDNCVLSYYREHEGHQIITILNLTPVPRDNYRIGCPFEGRLIESFNTDLPRYHGSGYPTFKELHTERIAWGRFPQSLNLNLPPMSALMLSRC